MRVALSCATFMRRTLVLLSVLIFCWTSSPAAAQTVPIEQISSGASHTCARDADGDVWCWGSNGNGQIGDGTFNGHAVPVKIQGLRNVQHIAAGGFHTCAIRANNRISCWGLNNSGQLGDGTNVTRTTPTVVPNLNGVAQLELGDYHSCARLNNGGVRCWGSNWHGSAGDGTMPNNRWSPVAVQSLRNVAEIGSGYNTSCARRSNARMFCWGWNHYGQIGDWTTDDRSSPVLVLDNTTQLTAGGGHTCALRTDGLLRCWGWNQFGQLGVGLTIDSAVPLVVQGLSNMVAVAAGGQHTCVLRPNSRVSCWGRNGEGQVGTGTPGTSVLTPTTVGNLSNVTAISLGMFHSCALRTGGDVRCWGSNAMGQLGDGSGSSSSATSVRVAFP
ncbi:MAG: RCC1 domain-containing protein [Roseinatronobacter sp.]